MLFVAPEFLLAFLPVVLAVYWVLEVAKGGRWSMAWLLVASLVFYAWSGWHSTLIFVASLALNYSMGKWLAVTHRRWALALGVGLNLSLLALFKYGDFLLLNLGSLLGTTLPGLHLQLPLAISFYTFQQIAYLVQSHRSRRADIPWRDYALAVAFFPHLIAGPLVHYRDIVSQFHSHKRRRVVNAHLHEGISLFIIALAKKILLADKLALVAGEVFGRAAGGTPLGIAEAWGGALAYTFQIYFDFSAYSEMALGLALMLGIHLPVNFRRPYCAVDLRDFWKRWHITLSEFLRDYLYIPLGGNRKGSVRRWLNLFLTMLLGGLWHGAGWPFLAWGGLHGLFLAVNHAWASQTRFRLPRTASRLLTFLVVVLLWVPFRAADWSTTLKMWGGMSGMASAPPHSPTPKIPDEPLDWALKPLAYFRAHSFDGPFWETLSSVHNRQWLFVGLAALLVFACRSNLDLSSSATARSSWWALFLGLLLFWVAAASFNAPPGQFIYFRF